jgi:hypothetical protein
MSSSCDWLTVKAAYPSCHAKSFKFGNVSLSQCDEELDGLLYSKRCGDRKEQVNMICHTADFESVHSVFARNTTEIGE